MAGNPGRNEALIRARGGLRQAELGQLIGVSQQTLSVWERGVVPPLKMILKLEAVLGVAKEELFREAFQVQSETRSGERGTSDEQVA